MVTLPSASVFFLKIHLHSTAFRSLGGSTKVHTWFSLMDPNSDFMASSHFSESGLIIPSSKFVGSLSSTNKTVKTGLPYHSGGARDLVDLRRSVAASSEAS